MGLFENIRARFARKKAAPDPGPPRLVDLRITADRFAAVRAHVENFSRGEEAGYVLGSLSRCRDRDVLLVRDWIPIPDRAIERYAHGSVLSWSADFNSEVLERAIAMDCSPVLVHSHGSPSPQFSGDDIQKERALFGTFSRLLGDTPTGTVLLGDGDAVGSFWTAGRQTMSLGRISIIGDTLGTWQAGTHATPPPPRGRLDRQTVAIGPASDAKLASAKVAVIGISGGGSHVVQQLAHQGVGTIIAVDDQVIDETNLGRVVGAVEADIDRTLKTDLAQRVATEIDQSIKVVKVPHLFPSPEAIEALKEADIIVSCVDRFDVRENINAFARRYLIPLVDIGLAIVSAGEHLAIADGQLAIALPGRPCWLITDAILTEERKNKPPGYDQNPDAPGDPQVVSLNGVLASEACNSVLDLITSYSGGRRDRKFWQYEGRSGTLTPHDIPIANPACRACAEEGFGDPPPRS
jgi:molybdopterin-synthase adenylyltransferase